jgi:hypothetical protein
MLKKNEFWIPDRAFAAIGLLLSVANMILFSQNRAAQAEVSGRAQYIQQAAQLEPLYREMVKGAGRARGAQQRHRPPGHAQPSRASR